ncbi:hypothetical protein BRD19_00025 [Halobacteriales archaeon SW_7_65_23]|nr:MAG: hypothetical protein BRD19_00025 [Halobacteriales archaeon SW_7_65_23]
MTPAPRTGYADPPIAPDEAVHLYLRDRQNELADATIDSYRYKLEKFVEWCEAEDVENLNSLSGREELIPLYERLAGA